MVKPPSSTKTSWVQGGGSLAPPPPPPPGEIQPKNHISSTEWEATEIDKPKVKACPKVRSLPQGKKPAPESFRASCGKIFTSDVALPSVKKLVNPEPETLCLERTAFAVPNPDGALFPLRPNFLFCSEVGRKSTPRSHRLPLLFHLPWIHTRHSVDGARCRNFCIARLERVSW
jgi:hypothetical protein